VQRFADYYPSHISETEYLIALGSAFGSGNFVQTPPTPNGEHSINVTYRTLENSTTPRPKAADRGGPSWRSTFANVFKRGNSLWVVSATVPVEQETSGRADLFDRVAGTFKILE
jgi:hypothetical protein